MNKNADFIRSMNFSALRRKNVSEIPRFRPSREDQVQAIAPLFDRYDYDKEQRIDLNEILDIIFSNHNKFNLIINIISDLERRLNEIENLDQSEAQDIRAALREVCERFEVRCEQILSSNAHVPKWPLDKRERENSEEFFKRVWLDAVKADSSLTKAQVKQRDPELISALKGLFNHRKKVPDYLEDWWRVREKPGPKTDRIDRLLSRHGINDPEDAHQRKELSLTDRQRLYAASNYRKNNKK